MAKFSTQTRTDHVQDMCCVVYRGRGYENNDIFLNCENVGLDFAAVMGWLACWLAAAKACAINSVTINSTGLGACWATWLGRWLAGISRKRLVENKSDHRQ